MSEDAATEGRTLLLRQGPITPEESEIFAVLRRQLLERGEPFVTVLLGSSSYEIETATDPVPGERWVPEDDARGRGLRVPAVAGVRVVSSEELVDAHMRAKRVISLP